MLNKLKRFLKWLWKQVKLLNKLYHKIKGDVDTEQLLSTIDNLTDVLKDIKDEIAKHK